MKNNKVLIIVIGLLVLGGIYIFATNNSADQMMEEETSSVELANEGTIMEEENMMMDDENAMMEEDAMMGEDDMMMEDEDAMMTDSEVWEFEVAGSNFEYDVTDISVTEGDTVRIVFNNVEGTHDWVIDEFDANTPVIQQGETAEVEFVADQAGTFEFYCSVGNHREMGMVGTLTVNPAE